MIEPETASLSAKERLVLTRGEMAKYLYAHPADPEIMASTIHFCQEGISLYTQAISLMRQVAGCSDDPAFQTLLKEQIATSSAEEAGYSGQEKFTQFQGTVIMSHPENSRIRGTETFSGIMTTASFIDPTLPRFEYAWNLALPISRNLRRATANPEIREKGRFYTFSRRFHIFREAAEEMDNLPLIQTLALIFLEELAKIKAVNSIKDQIGNLKPENPTFFLAPPRETQSSVNYVLRRIEPTLCHLGYLRKVKDLQFAYRNKYGIDEEQFRLLCDVAFFRRRHELKEGEVQRTLYPLIQAVVDGRWEDAASSRQFLLANFLDCFPIWIQQKNVGSSYESLNDLVLQKIATGEIDSFLEAAPADYKNLLSEKAKEILAKEDLSKLVEEQRKEHIRQQTLLDNLLTMAVGLASVRQYERGEVNSLLDLDEPFGYSNPLVLRFRQGISDFDSLDPLDHQKTIWDLGVGIHQPVVIFRNLLYQDLVNSTIVINAFNRLKEKGELEPKDTIYSLLTPFIEKSIQDLKEGLERDSYKTAKQSETANRKIEVLTNFINEFLPNEDEV